jgi:hypothetical protein
VVNKAIVIENKIKEMAKDGKRKVSISGQSSRSNVRPRFSQPNQFFQATADELHADADAIAAPPISDAMPAVPDAEAKCSVAVNIIAVEPPGCADAAMTEATTGTPPHSATFA